MLLLVDAQEGPKPQTRFVLKKALALGLRVLVVVNKIDKPAARLDYVIDKTFDLFCELGASDEQARLARRPRLPAAPRPAMPKTRALRAPAQTDFPVVYTSAINRIAGDDPDNIGDNMEAIFKKIMELPKPKADFDGSLQLQISNIGTDPFIGRLGIGRIRSGSLKKNSPIGLSAGPGTEVTAVVTRYSMMMI